MGEHTWTEQGTQGVHTVEQSETKRNSGRGAAGSHRTAATAGLGFSEECGQVLMPDLM